jgi:hypothetical protein
VAELAGLPELEELAAGLGATPQSLGDELDKPDFRYLRSGPGTSTIG